MKERIGKALSERLKEDPHNEWLQDRNLWSSGTDHYDPWILSVCDPQLLSYD